MLVFLPRLSNKQPVVGRILYSRLHFNINFRSIHMYFADRTLISNTNVDSTQVLSEGVLRSGNLAQRGDKPTWSTVIQLMTGPLKQLPASQHVR